MLCSSCGKDKFELDNNAGTVCTNCGAVKQDVSLSALTDDAQRPGCDNYHHSNHSYKQSLPAKYAQQIYFDRQQLPPGKKLGYEVLDIMLSKLHITDQALREESKELFEKVYHHKEFIHKPLSSKYIISSVCVYCVCRRDRRAITMEQMSQVVGCDRYTFGSICKKITELFNLTLPQLNTEDVIASVLANRNFSDVIIKRTFRLVQLCQESMPSMSALGNINSIAIPACFIVHQSIDVKYRHMRLCTFELRHQLSSLRSDHTTKKYRDIIAFLAKLARHIPWINRDMVNQKNVYLHLTDILDYKRTLVSSMKAETPDKNEFKTGGNTGSKRDYNAEGNEVISLKRQKISDEGECSQQTSETDHSCKQSEFDIPDSDTSVCDA